VLLLGGPLLLAAVGAATTVAVSGRARARDAALLESAGATPGLVVATAAWEAVVQVGTATLLALVAVATTAIAGAWAVGSWSLDPGAFGLPALGVTAGAALLLVLTATVVPAVLRLRQDPVAVLSAQ
jgi:putative ABC transport system permease protein